MRRRPSGSAIEEDNEEPPSSTDSSDRPDRSDTNKEPRETVTKGRRASRTRRKRQASDASVASSTAGRSHVWGHDMVGEKAGLDLKQLPADMAVDRMAEGQARRRARLRNPWAVSAVTLAALAAAVAILFTIVQSFNTRQLDPKGCAMSYMRTSFVRFPDFDTEHTRFATKYSLYLYRELEIDEDTRVKGVPVLFIPGNAGSYKQVRSFASEAAYHYYNTISNDAEAITKGKRALDFFSVDFNEDITAFHGQTLLDQAEYLNDAIAYILSLYHNPHRSIRDPSLADPSSVIIIGHSMGGIVARTMLTMPNYQSNTINTILTLSAPHARAPVSFDSDIVNTYKQINDYWRQSYSQKWANDNPLWHVTLVSIAGGGLDTVVPSDYASVASLVPETHGFTVFTSTIPGVWTGMDHLAITWCDQLRKSVIRAIYEVVDVGRSVQTRPRAERMRAFKKWFLTGLEDGAERNFVHQEPQTLLTLEDTANSVTPLGSRLLRRYFGRRHQAKVIFMPIPPSGTPEGKRFTLLTDQKLDASGDETTLEVLFCSVFPPHPGQAATLFTMDLNLKSESAGNTRLACKNVASDAIRLPASTKASEFPFDDVQPFHYLQYDLEDLAEFQFVAVVDKAPEPRPGWVVAEFNSRSDSTVDSRLSLRRLLTTGLHIKLPAKRPFMTDIKVPALHSSLLAYKLRIHPHTCIGESELFPPLVRQYITDVYESKYYVNANEADINLHGVAPYMPPAFRTKGVTKGLSLQIWSDSSCESPMDISMEVDWLGSTGKLWMRYRTLFVAFPILVVALVLRKQFKVYDETGVFMSFSEAVNQCSRTSLPVLMLALTFLTISLAKSSQGPTSTATRWMLGWRGNATESALDYTTNDLLLGLQDSFFWVLIPLFGIASTGICIMLNFVTLALTYLFAFLYGRLRNVSFKADDGRRTPAAFAVTTTKQRIITTSVLLAFVATVIPYQFAYLVLCIVQIATCTRALRLALDTNADANYNFYNYVHSVSILMLWILPINLPVLVVWMRNLAVHWLTPFSSHHNILSIMPYILLVETLSTGRMIPRITTRVRYFANAFLFGMALYAAIYGVTYAYRLHHLANILCAWLMSVHFSGSSLSALRLDDILEDENDGKTGKKRP